VNDTSWAGGRTSHSATGRISDRDGCEKERHGFTFLSAFRERHGSRLTAYSEKVGELKARTTLTPVTPSRLESSIGGK